MSRPICIDPTELDYLGLGPVLVRSADLLDNGIVELVPNNTHPDVPLKAYTVHENVGTLTQSSTSTAVGRLT
jgi:hypothetical protein